MKGKLLVLLIVVLLLAIVFSGCFEESETNGNRQAGFINTSLNVIEFSIDNIPNEYIFDNKTYSDNPPVWNEKDAIETLGLYYVSMINGLNNTISIWLVRYNSSFIAQDDLYDFISWGSSSSGLSEMYIHAFDEIGDESILKAYFGQSMFSDSKLNKSSVNMFFRVKNVVIRVEKIVDNINMSMVEFSWTNTYENYCNEVWNYSKLIEKNLNEYVVTIEDEEPGPGVLVLKEFKNENSGNTVVMDAEEYLYDLFKSNISGMTGMFSLHEPNAGDSLIIKSNISTLEYEPLYDDTIVGLESGDFYPSIDIFIQGNITNRYAIGDEVEITLHVAEVNYIYLGEEYFIKIIEETWRNLKSHIFFQTYPYLIDTSSNPISQNQITKSAGEGI